MDYAEKEPSAVASVIPAKRESLSIAVHCTKMQGTIPDKSVHKKNMFCFEKLS
jgi:hypothetical protein